MRIAVTGAGGMLARYVIPGLLDANNEVISVVRPRGNPFDLAVDVQVVEHDIVDGGSSLLSKIGELDALLHLAWGGLDDFQSLLHIDVELPVHYKFVREIVQGGVNKIFIAGTCLEYGAKSGGLHELMDVHPDSPYGYAKNSLRRQLEFLKEEVPFDLGWFRLFYLYGDDKKSTGIYSQFKKAVERGECIFNMSMGEQLRDYLHVEDAARYIVELILAADDVGLVNISSGNPASVRRLVEGWIEESGANISLNLGFYPYPEYEPLAFWGESNKRESILEGIK